jgi:hypothetical protein
MAQPNHTPLLPHLRSSQPPRPLLRIHKAPLGLGSHHPRPLPAAAWRGERTLFLARCPEVLFPLVPGVVGLHPSSFHRRMRKLRRFFEPLRREVLSEMIGNPETLLYDFTLLEVLHPRQVPQSSGFPAGAWVRWGSFTP